MVFAITNHEMAVFNSVDAGAMRRLNDEFGFRHGGGNATTLWWLSRLQSDVADDTDLEISSLPCQL